MLIFKIIKGISPVYLQDLISICGTPFNLRDPEIKLDLPGPSHAQTIASMSWATAGRYYGIAYPSIYGN